MRVHCHLRTIREQQRRPDGRHVSVAEMARRTGISNGILSLIERGVMIPPDRQLVQLEAGYGVPFEDWYDPRTLTVLQRDEAAE